jgi:hypothetical protein
MSATTAPPRLYRVSALASALVRMWRAWAIVIPVVVLNAIVQALLVLPDVMPGLSLTFIALALVSLLVLIASFALVATALLLSTRAPVTVGGVISVARGRFLPMLAWAIGLLAVVLIGLVLYVVPGLIVLAITPFLLLAVLDGRGSPLAVNFRTIGARWGRWLLTIVTMGVLSFLVWLLSALDGFFITGAPGALIGWILIGFVATWFTAAWTLIYRSVNP